MAKTTFGQQLIALFWRNYLLMKRMLGSILFKILMPTLMIGSLSTMKPGQQYNSEEFPVGNATLFNLRLQNFNLCITPNNSNSLHVGNLTVRFFENLLWTNVSYTIFNSELDLQKAIQQNIPNKSSGVCNIGIIFPDDLSKNGSYVIRMLQSNIPDPNVLYGSLDECRNVVDYNLIDSKCPALKYYFSHFSITQAAVDSAIIQFWTNKSDIEVPNVHISRYPMDSYTPNTWKAAAPFYFIAGFSPLISILAMMIVQEKERRIKEGMMMMGMKSSVYWISWFITESISVGISVVIQVLLIYKLDIFPNASIVIVFIMLLLFGFSVIMMAFMITPFFNKSQVAGSVTGLLVLVFSMFYLLAVYLKDKISVTVFYILSLISPAAFTLGIVTIADLHGELTMSTLFDGKFPIGASIIMLLVDIILYGLLAYYFDNVIPGQWGPHRKPWFCFTSEFWRSSKAVSFETEYVNSTFLPEEINENIETVPDELHGKEAIRIQNIKKIFHPNKKNEVIAVDGINLTIYEGQITALLGHNGAGKTTLVNILIGTIQPTSGDTFIYDLNIRNSEDMMKLRCMMGVCLQENILYDQLTAFEHLLFFAKLKGLEGNLESIVHETLQDVNLQDVGQVQSVKLSGGQKRKLCVGIALIGNPKVIFLDEPSSGLDPCSRQHMWSLLQRYKKNRVILLTTHFMDEADILADRKAIISRGKLRCAGSSLFLKNRFGLGYHLTIVADVAENKASLIQMVESHINEAKCSRTTTNEITFILPLTDTSKFSALFETVERALACNLHGISDYGVSMTTLEDVFLKLSENDEVEDNSDQQQTENMQHTLIDPEQSQSINLDSCTMKPSPLQGFLAFLKLRFLLFLRNPMHIVPIVVFPVIAITFTYIFMKPGKNISSNLLHLTPSLYPNDTFYMRNLTGHTLENMVTEISQQGLKVAMLSSSPNYTALYNSYMTVVVKDSTNIEQMSMQWLFNSVFIHSLPILQNIMSNVLLASVSSTKFDSQILSISSHPVTPLNQENVVTTNPEAFTYLILISLFFAYTSPLIAVEVVEDRENKVKNQLRVSGLNFFSYWGTVLLTHMIVYIFAMALLLAAVSILKIQLIQDPTEIAILWIIFVLYAPASLLACYIITHMFDKLSTAKGFLPTICFLLTMFTFLQVLIMDSNPDLNKTATTLHFVYCFLCPFYVPCGTMYFLIKVSIAKSFKTINGLPFDNSDYFKWDTNIPVCFVGLVVQIVIFSILLRIVDIAKAGGHIRDALYFPISFPTVTNNDIPDGEDEDVEEERSKIKQDCQLTNSEQPVVINQLRKEYHERCTCKNRQSKVAIRNLSFSIGPGKIFGLLGPNGAGKTSVMKIIIGEERATNGSVHVVGHRITSNISDAFNKIGYCPQHDAFWKRATLEDHLHLYAAIRGVSSNIITEECDRIMVALNIKNHAKKRAEELSGGTKRKEGKIKRIPKALVCFLADTLVMLFLDMSALMKGSLQLHFRQTLKTRMLSVIMPPLRMLMWMRKLSYAISLFGKSKLIMLDEPSTGMDPQSKSFMWNTIYSAFSSDNRRGALLTTHSMEEADALCTRIGIMVQGVLRCLGSRQHLKNKYGKGYVLEIKLTNNKLDYLDQMNCLKTFVTDLCPTARVKESFGGWIQYTIPQSDVSSLADIFSALEKAKLKIGIDDYSFSQTTLEQVFIGLAKEQETTSE